MSKSEVALAREKLAKIRSQLNNSSDRIKAVQEQYQTQFTSSSTVLLEEFQKKYEQIRGQMEQEATENLQRDIAKLVAEASGLEIEKGQLEGLLERALAQGIAEKLKKEAESAETTK